MFYPGIYGVSKTVYFPLVDFGATDFESTPVTFAAGDTQIIKDGGTAANSTNTPAHEGNGIYSLVLTATEMEAETIVITLIDQTATKLWEDQAVLVTTEFSGQLEANQAIFIGEVDTATFTATTTVFEALKLWPDTTEPTTADRLNNRRLIFTSGASLGEGCNIEDYELANSKFKFTVTLLASIPADGVRFVIL